MREELLSVGIDIGTSTTQLVFSKLIIENMASSYTVPRIVIVDKQIVYRSEIYFTPLKSATQIDGGKIKEIIEKEYEKADILKESIQTGAVIITGETARKENAKEVLEMLSGFAGDFVVATAGPDLESIISGKGAGAHTYSKEHNTTVVNIDIGGGTSNLAVFRRGEVIDTGCLDVGGRLIKIDPVSHEITYISDKLRQLIERKNEHLSVGMTADKKNLSPVIEHMVKALEQSIGLIQKDEIFPLFITNKSIEHTQSIECISFSGGVGEYVYEPQAPENVFLYGDIGILLAEAIQKSLLMEKLKVIESVETIRATVVGAGTHTTEISGSTITYTKDAFPIKNLPILKLSHEKESKIEELGACIEKKLNWFELEGDLQKVAIAFQGEKNPSFGLVTQYADACIKGMKKLIDRELPLVVIVEQDMAKVLGQSLYQRLGASKDVICLDSIHLDNGDYIDIGRPIAEGSVLPVVVKTLIFNK